MRFTDGATEVVYFNQLDERYANKPYGTDNIGGYGCGPTAMSIVVSSLTSETVDPIEMAKWSYENGGWCSKSGSYHALIPNAAKAWGLTVEGCTAGRCHHGQGPFYNQWTLHRAAGRPGWKNPGS